LAADDPDARERAVLEKVVDLYPIQLTFAELSSREGRRWGSAGQIRLLKAGLSAERPISDSVALDSERR
jgi:hypothetical protein